jgi:hypothetical protein
MASLSRCAAFSVAAAVFVSLSVAGGGVPAYADPVAVSSLVDDGVYPGAAQILAEQNVRLLAGDGHITLADCATPPVGDIGLLKVYTTDDTIGSDGIGRVCFKVTATVGWLTLQVPGVYEIRGDGQRTGTGHEVTADLVSDEGEHNLRSTSTRTAALRWVWARTRTHLPLRYWSCVRAQAWRR